MFNKSTWKDGEKQVADYMKKMGYKILYTNFSCPVAELDIVAIYPKNLQIKNLKKEYELKFKQSKSEKELQNLKNSYNMITNSINDILVITEVKARANDKFGHGYDSITKTKKNHMIRGAQYLLNDPKFENLQVRFDVASVDNGKLTYIENAFTI